MTAVYGGWEGKEKRREKEGTQQKEEEAEKQPFTDD